MIMLMRSGDFFSKYNECYILVNNKRSIEPNLYDSQQLNLNYYTFCLRSYNAEILVPVRSPK